MKSLLAFLAALGSTLAASLLVAATICVDDDAPNDPGPGDPALSDPLEDGSVGHPYDAIQEGINVAAGGDTVRVEDGTYTGDGNRDLDFGGKAILLRSRRGARVTIINCEGLGRGFSFHSGESELSVINGFTIRRGSTSTNGGGVSCGDGSSPTISNCVIAECRATLTGGGLFLTDGSNPTIRDCTIITNRCENGGAGIRCHVDSSPTVTGCTITGNEVAQGDGGGIFVFDGTPEIADCVIWGNSAEGGGGICCLGNASITDCTIVWNAASRTGGGIACWDSSPMIDRCVIAGNSLHYGYNGGGIACYGGNPEIASSIISNNGSADYGGGIYLETSSAVVVNCTITGNQAVFNGGGVFIHFGAPAITNCTIADNNAMGVYFPEYGGGLYCDFGNPRLVNTIIWDNRPEEILVMPSADLVAMYCCIGDGDPNDGTVYPGLGNIDDDPVFASPASGNYRPQLGSACVDAGTSDGAPERDINGAPRWDERTIPNTGGGDKPWYDIGAYEFYRGRRYGQLDPQPRKGPKSDSAMKRRHNNRRRAVRW